MGSEMCIRDRRMLRRRVALLRERVHPLLVLTKWWRSVGGVGRPTLTLRADHEVAVGLRCGKANTKSPRSLVRLDPVFTRDNSGRSILFPIKEESSRLATSFPFSKRANGKEPPRVRPMLPPTRVPLMKTPTGSVSPALSSRTLTHVHQATSITQWSR